MSDHQSTIEALTKDLRNASRSLSDAELRYLVDSYYIMQDQRIRAEGQLRALSKAGEPSEVILHLASNSRKLEKQVEVSLDVYTYNHPVGQWARAQKGIGPVITAGLLAHIDITKAPTVGHIWSFAGLNPNVTWEKGKKRPWNATLKTLCWKIGESFVKVSGGEKPGYYGLVYKARKEWEIQQNEAGAYADQAKKTLERFKFRDDTVAKGIYLQGRLPPAHIHRRACRYAVKLFLSHLHHRWYEHHFGTPPPMPYAITILGHGHYLPPPEASFLE